MREENSEGVTDVLSPKNVGARHTDRFFESILLFSENVLTFNKNNNNFTKKHSLEKFEEISKREEKHLPGTKT